MKIALEVEQLITGRMAESIAVKQSLLEDQLFPSLVVETAAAMVECLRGGGTIFFFGNGGSAADAQHLAAELAGRYLVERRPLRGVALTTNTSCLTAIGNDYGYELVFARQLEAFGSMKDIAFGLSTSGNSPNVLAAIRVARRKRMLTIGMTGASGGQLRQLTDYCLCVNSDQTPRIQEAHITIGHILCEIVERQLAQSDLP